MKPVIKADGTVIPPEIYRGRGRPIAYPFKHLEIGDHFEADYMALPSLKAMISTLRHADREHDVERGVKPGTIRVYRRK